MPSGSCWLEERGASTSLDALLFPCLRGDESTSEILSLGSGHGAGRPSCKGRKGQRPCMSLTQVSPLTQSQIYEILQPVSLKVCPAPQKPRARGLSVRPGDSGRAGQLGR